SREYGIGGARRNPASLTFPGPRPSPTRFADIVQRTRPGRTAPDLDTGEQPEQLMVHRVVPGNDRARAEHRVTAGEVAHKSTGFAHKQDPGCHVPGREIAFPIAVDAAGRDPGQIERRRTKAAKSRHLVLNDLEL